MTPLFREPTSVGLIPKEGMQMIYKVQEYAKAFVAFAIPAAAAVAVYAPDSENEGLLIVGLAVAVVTGLAVAVKKNTPL